MVFLRARWDESSLVGAREGISAEEAQLPRVMAWGDGASQLQRGLDIQIAPYFPAWVTEDPKGPQ